MPVNWFVLFFFYFADAERERPLEMEIQRAPIEGDQDRSAYSANDKRISCTYWWFPSDSNVPLLAPAAGLKWRRKGRPLLRSSAPFELAAVNVYSSWIYSRVNDHPDIMNGQTILRNSSPSKCKLSKTLFYGDFLVLFPAQHPAQQPSSYSHIPTANCHSGQYPLPLCPLM